MTDQTTPRRRGRPATGVTPVRHLRIPDPLWDRVVAAAGERRESATALIVRATERELARLARARPTPWRAEP